MATDLLVEKDIDRDTTAGVRRLRISREMYMGMLDAGVITENQRVQLIDGEIYEMSPMADPHWIAVTYLLNFLGKILPDEWSFTCQSPIVTDEYGEPEPDIAIFRGSMSPGKRKKKATATETSLVIEVADSTLNFDRTKKLVAYAEAEIPEYWIVNLAERIIEIYTDPQPRNGERRGKYAVLREYRPDEKVAIRLDGEKIVEFTVGDLFI